MRKPGKIFFFAAVALAGTVAAAPFIWSAQEQPFDRSRLLRELTEAPSVPFVSEEDRDQLVEGIRGADAVFTGIVKGVVLSRMGIGGPSIPMSRVFFEDIQPLKGRLPKGDNFLSLRSPDNIKVYRNRRALVLLIRSEDKSKTLFIERILNADKEIMNLVKEALKE